MQYKSGRSRSLLLGKLKIMQNTAVRVVSQQRKGHANEAYAAAQVLKLKNMIELESFSIRSKIREKKEDAIKNIGQLDREKGKTSEYATTRVLDGFLRAWPSYSLPFQAGKMAKGGREGKRGESSARGREADVEQGYKDQIPEERETPKAIMREANRKEDKAKGEKRGERGWEMEEERVESLDWDKAIKRKTVTATAGIKSKFKEKDREFAKKVEEERTMTGEQRKQGNKEEDVRSMSEGAERKEETTGNEEKRAQGNKEDGVRNKSQKVERKEEKTGNEDKGRNQNKNNTNKKEKTVDAVQGGGGPSRKEPHRCKN